MKFYFRLFSFFLCRVFLMPVALFANYEAFTQTLQKVWIDISVIEKKSSISRFEMARLLNAIECEDCIVPSPRTQQHYSLQFWTDFSKTPDRNLQDITYRGAWREKQDYYYCVAYVGEQEYMKGYPQATSPICGGKFCGQNAITKPEFFQAVLNIIDETIMKNYQANRADIKNRVAKLSPASYQYRVLVEKDLQAIQSADTKSKAITTSDQFQAYLKYCMFNLSQCGFQTFGNIGYGYWPVSELNVLIREGIITRTDIENIYDNLKGSDALKILYYVYRNYSKCSVNDDYDCDTISNKDDNCPYTYNPNQLDMDYDGKGNVCDDDIDGDGKKNPEGIVDDNDNIIIGKWDPEGDDTPLGEGKRGFGLFINVQTLTDTIPARITAKVITDGDLQSLQRSMDDGKNYTTTLPSIMHTYNAPGTYTISVLATDKSGKKAEASTKVYIAPGTNLQYQLAIQPAFTFKNGEIEYAFSASSKGDLDGIVRSFNNKDITEVKINEAVKKTFPQNETITVHAKAYYQNELKAVASMTLIHASSPKFSSLQVTKGTLQTPTSITTNLVGQRVQEITNILRNWGDGTTTTGTSLTASHLYPSSGIKTLQQTIFLKNGQHLENVVTFFVENPFKSHSMALNINGTQFSYAQAQATNLSLSLLPISSATPISITNTFGVNQTQTFPATPLSKIKLQTTYTSAGSKTVTSFGEINRCVSLVNQGTVYVSSADRCLTALKNGTLSQYKCDMDGDSIPDICDDDIDGDGKKNLLGLIQYEKADCSYDSENIDEEILRKHFGVCSLDNCPFALNSDQVDLNNNGIGDLCESRTVRTISTPVNNDTLRKYDQDKDGIPDDVDLCPSIPGDRAHQGCPGFWKENDPTDLCESSVPSTCGNGKLDPGETCLTCPEDAGSQCIICGDAICDPGESNVNCPTDCPPPPGKCWDGVLDPGETCRDCPEDTGPCKPVCGDAICDPGESNVNCPTDCPPPPGKCWDGVLDPGETCRDCPEDTGPCKPLCWDGKCEVGESNINCPSDCPPPPGTCWNGKIDPGETCRDCPADTGPCKPLCWDGKCEVGESNVNCPSDCPPPPGTCWNGKIDPGETCRDCPADTGPCKPLCWDGKCEVGESNVNCPADCPPIDEKCWNGKLDPGENCSTCPSDAKPCDPVNPKCDGICGVNDCKTCLSDCDTTNICLAYCVQNGKKDPLETCDPTDLTKQWRGNKGCSTTCQPINEGGPEDPDCDGVCGVNDCEVCLSDCDTTNICLAYCVQNGKKDPLETCDPTDLTKQWRGNKGCSTTCQPINEGGPEDPDCDGVCGVNDCEVCLSDCDTTNICLAYCVQNGKKDPLETCDPTDLTKQWRGNKGCSTTCQPINEENPNCDGICGVNDCTVCISDCEKTDICLSYCIPNGIRDPGEECDPSEAGCTAFCKRINPPETRCDGICGVLDCDLCPTDCDQTERCITHCGNGILDPGEECDAGLLNGKNGICSLTCKMETCGNGRVDPGETCESCPQDLSRCIVEQNCNMCPCPYADFASDLILKDRIRAKLRDASRKVFYSFSPEVLLSNFL